MPNPTPFSLLPKIELHLHLEGAIPLPALWELIGKYGGAPGIPDLAVSPAPGHPPWRPLVRFASPLASALLVG